MEYLSINNLNLQHTSISTITNLITKYACTILNLHMQNCGASMFLVAGTWNAIAKLETALQKLNNEQNIFILKRLELPQETNAIPYNVLVTGPNKSLIIEEVINFFLAQNLTPNNLHVETHITPTTHTNILILTALVNIPLDTNMTNLREQFLVLCDDLNVDGILEPERRY